jgi:hypothetical protein
MSWSTRVWILLLIVYATFFSWYTSFAGPLNEEEIAHYSEVLSGLEPDPERLARWQAFMRSDTGDDFAMINVVHLNDIPTPGPGIEPGETSEEVAAKYSEPFMSRAFRNAAHPVMMGFAAADALDTWGIDAADTWTAGALVRYRSRRDLMEQSIAIRQMDGTNIHDFKIAAIAKTIAYPLDPWFQLGDPRLVLALLLIIVGLASQIMLGRSTSA